MAIQEKSGAGPGGRNGYLPAGSIRSYLVLLRANPRFRRFWLAGVISHIGNWFNYVGIFVLLDTLTGRGGAVSWFLIAKFMPTSILGPAAGVIADRFPRKTVMVACDLGRALVVPGFLLVDRPDQVWLVYGLTLLQESLMAFYDPARRASVPNLCTEGELLPANALAGATWSVMLAIGASLGGLFTATFGWRSAIVFDSLTFAVSALLIAGLDLPHRAVGARTEKRTWRDYTGFAAIGEGWRYMAGHREVGALLLVKSGWAIAGGVLVLLAVFGEKVFRPAGNGMGSGVLYSFRGIGAALGPMLAWRFLGESRKEMERSIGLSFFVTSFAYLLFSQAPGLWWAAPCVLLAHLGGSVQWVFSTTMLQKTVPDRFRGRVFAAEMALLTVVLSLSTYCTGLGLDKGVPPRTLAVVLALLFLVPGVVWRVGKGRKTNC